MESDHRVLPFPNVAMMAEVLGEVRGLVACLIVRPTESMDDLHRLFETNAAIRPQFPKFDIPDGGVTYDFAADHFVAVLRKAVEIVERHRCSRQTAPSG